MLYLQTPFQHDCDSKEVKIVLKPNCCFNTSTLPSSKIQKGTITRACCSLEFHCSVLVENCVGAWPNEWR